MEFVELDTEHGEAVKRADPGEPCCACPEGGGARWETNVPGFPCFPVPPSHVQSHFWGCKALSQQGAAFSTLLLFL